MGDNDSGPLAACGFGFLAISRLVTTGLGIRHAMAGDQATHRQWVTRSIALTLAAVTLRLYLPIPLLFELNYSAAYTAIAWLCQFLICCWPNF